MKRYDISVTGSWGLYTIAPRTVKGRKWLIANCSDGERTWGEDGSLICEGGDNCRAIVAAMVKARLCVEVNGVDMKGFKAA